MGSDPWGPGRGLTGPPFHEGARPQASPSDEEAGWARDLHGQTADPLPGRTPSLGSSLEGDGVLLVCQALLGKKELTFVEHLPWCLAHSEHSAKSDYFVSSLFHNHELELPYFQ